MKKGKIIIAWIILIILIIMVAILSYLKFFGIKNEHIEEKPIENSSSEAINNALEEIVTNFNKNPKIQEYKDQGIQIEATLNNYSIYISYTTDTSTTYEFNYENLILKIMIENNPENLSNFKIIYQLLIEAVQERLGNTEDVTPYVTNLFETETTYTAIWKESNDNTLSYYIDITKELNQDGEVYLENNNSLNNNQNTANDDQTNQNNSNNDQLTTDNNNTNVE